MTFSETAYASETFEALVLPEACLEDIEFYDCQFEHCQFVEASFKRSSFIACTFTNCDLSMVNVTDTLFEDCRISATVAAGVNWSLLAKHSVLGVGLYFEACTLHYSIFRGLDLKGKSFVECLARDCDFSGADLQEADFSGADLQGAEFDTCNLSKAIFTGAKNYQINVLTNKVKGAKFAFPEVIGLLAGLGIELDT